MYYDIESEFHQESEPRDYDEEIKDIERRKSEHPAPILLSDANIKDAQEYQTLYYLEQEKSKILAEKAVKLEIEASANRVMYNNLLERSRYVMAERLFLTLLCGFAFLLGIFGHPKTALDILLFVFVAFLAAFIVALVTTALFPKERSRFWLPGYERHPMIVALIFYVIVSVAVCFGLIYFV